MTVDYIIIGQGLSGTFLSYYLQKAGKKIFVIDDGNPRTASRAASGVINPVTGRSVVATWMIEDLLPFCLQAYNEIGAAVAATVVEEKNILAFPPTVQMCEAYNKRLQEKNIYLKETDANAWTEYFNYPFGCLEIVQVLLVNVQTLLAAFRKKLLDENFLLEENFDENFLQVENDGCVYKNIHAEKIFYCSGIHTYKSSYWKNIPYVLNKGEALLAEIPGLPAANIYKFANLTLVPFNENLWWVGSSYENDFENDLPTEKFRNTVEASMKSILKIPFTITEHLSSIRPAALERRPFVGLHPAHSSVGILNGMGTKGCSLAPWFASELAMHLIHGAAINPLADVKRFKRMLSQ